jgi:hypothetical protein
MKLASEPMPIGDELGPAKIVHVHEPALGLEAVLVIDNVARGAPTSCSCRPDLEQRIDWLRKGRVLVYEKHG